MQQESGQAVCARVCISFLNVVLLVFFNNLSSFIINCIRWNVLKKYEALGFSGA